MSVAEAVGCRWHYDDGGRAAAGFTVSEHDAGDCVARAIAIVTGRPYRMVYDRLASVAAEMGYPRSARDGVRPKVYKHVLAEWGWEWTPTMQIGSGCTVHMVADELPSGWIIVRLSKHLAAVVDGVVLDTADPTRDGTRCVYGYWKRADF